MNPWEALVNTVGVGCTLVPLSVRDVLIRYEEGDEAVLRWHDDAKRWYFTGKGNVVPGDIAARDSL